jgi:sugar-specific transcriptional regulator TrmB
MKLITEVYDDGCSVLTEASEDGKKGYFIEGIFMQGDVKNRNGRIYPSNILENEMKRYNDQFIKTKRALGELGHPNGPQINGDRVSHLITEMKRDGSNFVGKAKILSTPMGEIVKTFIDEGVKVGVSTRGLGSVKPTKEGIMEVQDDFHLATVDIVTDPSGPNCFVNGIMENTEYYYDIASGNWRVMERLEETVKELKKEVTVRNPIGEAKALRIFENFIASLK